MTRFPVIRKLISSEKSHAESAALVLLAVLIATLVRWAISGLAPHLTFVTYFPAILICCLLTGWRYGAASAFISSFVAELLFPPPGTTTGFGSASIASLFLFIASCAVIIATADTLRRAIRDLDRANGLAEGLNRELQHRVTNMLAVVQALASQSAKAPTPSDFVASFKGRLDALASAHRLLAHGQLETCSLPDLVDLACEPFNSEVNIIKTGPPCQLPSESCVPLVLALHELCTNAVKYGALSVSGGTVELRWSFEEASHQATVVWKEAGGPPVRAPTRKGIGSALLQPQSGLKAVDLLFKAEGVVCNFTIVGAEP